MVEDAVANDSGITLRRVVRLWPEAVLLLFTGWLIVEDGLRTSAGDPGYYWEVAGRVGSGLIPWRDFPFEYPPLSLLPVLLPYFAPNGSGIEAFLRGLFIENVVMLVAIGIGVLWLARQGWSRESVLRSSLMYVLLAIALAPTVLWRFDALSTLLSVLAVVAVARNHAVLSGMALGGAIMTKLYPLAMLPALVVGRVRGRGLKAAALLVAATVATVGLIAAPFAFLAGRGSISYVEYATGRGVQIESIPGALAMLGNVLGGPDARIYHGFGTWQVDSPLLAILSPTWTALTVVMIGALGIAIWHRFRVDRAAAGGLRPTSEVVHLMAALMVVLVSSRVLSPQYLFWVVPFVALSSRPKTIVFWVAALLTAYGYPLNFQEMLNQQADVVIAVNIRNAILLGYLAWVLAPDLLGAARSVADRFRTSPGATAPSG